MLFRMNKEKVVMVMSSLYINKQNLSIIFFNNEIEKKILLKGWKKQGADFEDQKLYCYVEKIE